MQPADIARIVSVAAPTLSPDGRRVAFVDLRCPPGPADQLLVALRLLGREVENRRFPEEGHEVSRSGSPRHRIQRAELILDFFGRHLGGRRPGVSRRG